MKSFKTGIVFAFLLSSFASAAPNETLTMCFIPGAGGGEKYTLETVPRELVSRGVPMKTFSVGFGGTVQTLASRFVTLLEVELQKDPNLVCHMVGYSMGGLTMRFAAAHLFVNHPLLGRIPVSRVMRSMTSISSPHRGTPLARILRAYLGTVDAGVEQLSEENVRPFNDAQNPNYSPLVEGIPFYSYLSFISSPEEAVSVFEQLGFKGILLDFARRGIADKRNDGIVPTSSQNMGQVVASLQVPHLYFSSRAKSTPSLPEFYELHWKFLNNRLASEFSGSPESKTLTFGRMRFLSIQPQ